MNNKRKRGIGSTKNFNIKTDISFGYIAVPSDYSEGELRDVFVENCYRKEKVSIVPERGGTFFNNCLISKQVLRDIRFPRNSGELGSGIAYFNEPNSGHPIIIGSFNKLDESDLYHEHTTRTNKIKGVNDVGVFIDAEACNLLLKSYGNKAKMTLNVKDLSDEALLFINVSGDVNVGYVNDFKVKGGELITLSAGNGLHLEVVGGANIILDDKISIKNTSDDLKSIIEDLITAITQITVTTPAGPSGVPINIVSFELIKQRLETLMK